MIYLYTAPNEDPNFYTPAIFLAGGITSCEDWQSEVIQFLRKELPSSYDATIYNPRRKNFPMDDPNAACEQITWEAKYLTDFTDIFTMYFCNADSDQPICMFELGKYVMHMRGRYPGKWKNKIIISVEDGYRRAEDVRTQMEYIGVPVFTGATPISHAQLIKRALMNHDY